MSNPAAEAEGPVFSIQKLYVKDISFESPNAPEVFAIPDVQPHVELNVTMENQQVNEEHWEVSVKVSATMHDKKNDKLLFEVEVEQAALFFMQNIPEDHLPAILGVECPTIIFPYVRQLVSQLTVDGGFMPLLLEPVNFGAAFEASRAEQQQTIN